MPSGRSSQVPVSYFLHGMNLESTFRTTSWCFISPPVPFNKTSDTSILIRPDDLMGVFLQFWFSVFYGDTSSRNFEHLDVVNLVTKDNQFPILKPRLGLKESNG